MALDSTPNGLRVVLVRLSALGDIFLTLPLVETLLARGVNLTWIIERRFLPVVQHLADKVELFPVDGPRHLAEYRRIAKDFSPRQFDVLIAAQAKLRINIAYPFIHAKRKVGFDWRRARDLQWAFCNERIAPANEHLADGMLAFARHLGIRDTVLEYAPPLDVTALQWCQSQLGSVPYLVLNPTSSKLERDWPLERQLEFVRRLPQSGWGGRLVIAAGHTVRDKEWAMQLAAAHPNTVNLAGKLSLPQLFALIAGAQAVITPDSAPVHIATAYKVPVIGLYVVARCALSGPWRAANYCVDCYSDGVKTLLRRDPNTADWHTRVHHPRAMELISVEQVLLQTHRALADSNMVH